MKSYVALGLMSGTSLDGMDVAAIRTDGEQSIEFISATTVPFPTDIRARLTEITQNDVSLDEILRLEKDYTNFAHTAIQALEIKEQVDVIGLHGQTIRHLPQEGLTWQLGNPQRLAALQEIPVVGDFRRYDLALGGEGAPLAPLYHEALAADLPKPLIVLNLGGVSNITCIAEDGALHATDCGPGMGLIDTLAQRELGEPIDRDGQLAGKGQPDLARVEQWLKKMPFFKRSLPRSADRYEFTLDKRYEFTAAEVGDKSPADAAATLCAFTAKAIAHTVQELEIKLGKLYVTGGGVHHPVVLSELKRYFKEVIPVQDVGWRPDSLEAECFAWFAVRRLRNLLLTHPTTTGVKRAVSGGVLTV